MAACWAVLRGASRVFVVDRAKERLEAAEKVGCEPVDISAGKDAVENIVRLNGGNMVDRSVDAVGYQATMGSEEEDEADGRDRGYRACACRRIRGAPDQDSAKGMMKLSFWEAV